MVFRNKLGSREGHYSKLFRRFKGCSGLQGGVRGLPITTASNLGHFRDLCIEFSETTLPGTA